MKWIGALVLRLMFVGSSSSETSESMFLDLDLEEESTKLTMIAPREKGVLYDVTHYQNALYVVTNRDGATNFKIVTTTLEKPGPENWKDVFPYDPKIKFDGFSAFKDFAILEGREGGFSQLWIFQGNEKKRVEFEEDSYDVNSSVNKEYETDTHRLVYSSLTTPPQTIDLNVKTGARTLLKEEPVLNFDRSAYQSKRIEATAEDGTVVPISLVYKKDLLTDGKGPKPCYLYGYGSYEISIDPSFHRTFLPIVDRNVVVAIAHIRGGGEMGRLHYEDAKYLKKKNTFTDFVTCAEKLIADGITAPDRLAIEGRSAGGLLVGAVVNMRPDLFSVALAGVPFVDVMNTMSGKSASLSPTDGPSWLGLCLSVSVSLSFSV